MNDIFSILSEIIGFRDERDWEQFHNAKDLALAVSIEAGELNELFLWKSPDQVDAETVKDELADVLIYCFLLANKYELDISEIIHEKLKKNSLKYPVTKAKGNSKKYNQF